MSKVIVEEFDACHRFMSDYVQFILLLVERKYVQLTHNVASENVVIFVNYDKNKINEFVEYIIKELQKSDLSRYLKT